MSNLSFCGEKMQTTCKTHVKTIDLPRRGMQPDVQEVLHSHRLLVDSCQRHSEGLRPGKTSEWQTLSNGSKF